MPYIESRQFNKLYRQAFGEILIPEGFETSKNAFYRLCDGVVQIFNLRTYSFDNSCDFCFDLSPTSAGLNEFYLEDYGISHLREAPNRVMNWSREELVKTNFAEPLRLTKEFVIPFFHQGIDAKSAYQTTLEIQKKVFNRVFYNWGALLYFALQAKDYDTYLFLRKYIYNNDKSTIEIKLKDDYSPEYKESLRQEQLQDEAEIKKLEEKAPEYIESLNLEIAEGEIKTMEFLESIKKKPRKKKASPTQE